MTITEFAEPVAIEYLLKKQNTWEFWKKAPSERQAKMAIAEYLNQYRSPDATKLPVFRIRPL